MPIETDLNADRVLHPTIESADRDRSVEVAGGCNIEPPDLSVLRLHRRPPPQLPLHVLGAAWKRWLMETAAAAACPVDYVVAALLPAASAMIGNARWAQATPGWCEPPHLWCASVGDSGQGKSPGADVIFRHIVPSIEARMASDFAQRVEELGRIIESGTMTGENLEADTFYELANESRLQISAEGEPISPRFMESDLTIEKVAMVLASAAPKGLLMARDELSGWLLGMNAYNPSARAFWIESYGGRPYRVDRVKNPVPIAIPHLAVAWSGGIQPARLERVMREADDGLLARFCWFWPDSVPFKLTVAAPDISFAGAAFEWLSMLEMAPPKEPGHAPTPINIPLAEGGRAQLQKFGSEMQAKQELSGGLVVSALGKARGLVLRLSLVLEYLWWAAEVGTSPVPEMISEAAMVAAITLVTEYLMPMAERVYGDAVASPQARNAATLARWIVNTRPGEVYVRHMQREVRLPGLGEAAAIHKACLALVEAGWLQSPAAGTQNGRARAAYPVRHELWEALQSANAPEVTPA